MEEDEANNTDKLFHMTTNETRRKKCDIAIHIDTEGAIKDGIPFYRSQHGILLTEGINGTLPCKYSLEIVNLSDGQEIDEPMQYKALVTNLNSPVLFNESSLDEYMRDCIDDTRDTPMVILNRGITNNFSTENAEIIYTFIGAIDYVDNKQGH